MFEGEGFQMERARRDLEIFRGIVAIHVYFFGITDACGLLHDFCFSLYQFTPYGNRNLFGPAGEDFFGSCSLEE